jgi:hypothetical protein
MPGNIRFLVVVDLILQFRLEVVLDNCDSFEYDLSGDKLNTLVVAE